MDLINGRSGRKVKMEAVKSKQDVHDLADYDIISPFEVELLRVIECSNTIDFKPDSKIGNSLWNLKCRNLIGVEKIASSYSEYRVKFSLTKYGELFLKYYPYRIFYER